MQQKDSTRTSFFLHCVNIHWAPAVYKVLGEAEMSNTWLLTLSSRNGEWIERKRRELSRTRRKRKRKRCRRKTTGRRKRQRKRHFIEHGAKCFTHHIPFYKCWSWGSNKINCKAIGGTWIYSKSDCLWSWHWDPQSPRSGENTQVKRRLQWCGEHLDCTVCISSRDPRVCSCIPPDLPLSLSVCSPLPCTCLYKERKKAKCRKKDCFPQTVQTEKKPAEAWTKGRAGRQQRGTKLTPEAFWLLSFILLSLVAFKFHSLFQWDLGIGLKFQ